MTGGPGQASSHAALRRELHRLHLELPKSGLVTWTSGNISARVPLASGQGGLLIKPSGVTFEDLTPEGMVLTDLNAQVLESDLSPSSDTATHAYIYRELPEVGGIVHTHSPYATAWAATGQAIPCVLTAMADEFGGPIPCGGFAMIGGEEIGAEVVRVLRGHRSPAVILQSHGVFTLGRTPQAALKAAVMAEDVARSVALAFQVAAATGTPVLRLDPQDIDRLYDRYTNVYGQRSTPAAVPATPGEATP